MLAVDSAETEQHYSLTSPTHSGNVCPLTITYFVNGEIDLSLLPTGTYRYYQQKLTSAAVVSVYAKTKQFSLGFIYAVIDGEMWSYNGTWHNVSQGQAQGSQQNASEGITAVTPGKTTEIVVLTRSHDLTACTIDTV